MLDVIKRSLRQWMTMMNPPVFFGAGGIVLAVIIFGGIWTQTAEAVFSAALAFITRYFSWYYMLLTSSFLVFVVWLYTSPYGRIRLGGPQSKPEFSKLSWLAMLFAAGMGMGLVFWGVAEPVSHYHQPPTAEATTLEAMRESLRYAFFHWGLHPWAIYIIFGMGIAYFHFRHQLPLAPRSILYPLIGERIHGPIGHTADITCTVGTLLGVSTSLGLGAMQINSGFESLTGWAYSTEHQLTLIAIITAVATTSTITGVGRGIKYLSMTNLLVMLLLLVFMMIVGPTLYQLRVLVTSLGEYLQELPHMSLWLDLSGQQDAWQSEWTLFYWGWWISWCPFVGVFLARISRGRTIREFISHIFILPPLVTFLWISAFGGTALHMEHFSGEGIYGVVADNPSMALNALLAKLPLAQISQWVSLLLITIFFITSSDSGSLVDDIVTSGGHPNPPAAQRAFWGISEGAAAAALLAAGGLNALQTASISGGLLQSILVILCCFSLVKALRTDLRRSGVPSLEALQNNSSGDDHEDRKSRQTSEQLQG
jgi:choline/glycine/proline betaine transport protein